MNRKAGPPRGSRGRRLGRDARGDDDRAPLARSARDRGAPSCTCAPASRELRGPARRTWCRVPVSEAYDGDAVIAQQQRRRDPALAEPDDRHFPAAAAPLLDERIRCMLSAPSGSRGPPARRACRGCRTGSRPWSRPSPASRNGGAAAPCGRRGARPRTPCPACACATCRSPVWISTEIASATNTPPIKQQQELGLEQDRDRAEGAADGEAAGVAHEHLRRVRVEPEKADASRP